jgi:hypothetical protein
MNATEKNKTNQYAPVHLPGVIFNSGACKGSQSGTVRKHNFKVIVYSMAKPK